MEQVYSVTQINRYIRNMFTREQVLDNLAIHGEISNCKYHSSGHIYFTLKDADSRLACVMFAGNRRGLDFTMQDGMSIIAAGSLSVYERDGKYQMYVQKVFREGYGELYERLEELKEKLSSEGLFSDINKKKIPYYSQTVGIVTASTGAAIQDIINISSRRNPYVQLFLYPAVVQGIDAASSIAAGIRAIDAIHPDVIIVGRGGGSFEDLFAFNEEEVVRAIYDCDTPVISAVGHEVDTTLSDLAADLRAPTPSAAAELAVREYAELSGQFAEYIRIFSQNIERIITNRKNKALLLSSRLAHVSPAEQIRQKRQYVSEIENELENIIQRIMDKYKHRLNMCVEKLKVLSPLHRLSGGYSYIMLEDETALKSIEQINTGDRMSVTLSDGHFCAEVKEIGDSDGKVRG